jgi:uncharacterized protein RhaS with RHS repeats
MGARVYDPYTGTFTQPDPIQGGGANAYGYTDGDPVNQTDLSGDSVVGDICVRTGNCTVHDGSPVPKSPTWGDVVQILTFATAPAALIDPFEDAGLAAEDSVGIDENAAGHIFRDAPGHLSEDTPANRELLTRTANNPDNYVETNEHGMQVHQAMQDDGSQVWTHTGRTGIRNGGVNAVPRR